METITISYDATNPAIRGLLAAFLKLDGVTKVSASKSTKPAAKKPRAITKADENTEIVAKVRRGREEFRKGKCTTIKADEIWN